MTQHHDIINGGWWQTCAGQLCASVSPTGNVVRLWVAASNAALAAVAMDTAAQVYISGVLDL